eukprot:TRINITY_DN149340_c0_g1_i1.p2 TRINITY_DN149340_c0_g1~~TRINITY_DN149340_c0_g1_i1.p2  ORF type:complete len:100 (+),score=6.68 TRINITY_DN149340_c0_g1_i1:228-527(+)
MASTVPVGTRRRLPRSRGGTKRLPSTRRARLRLRRRAAAKQMSSRGVVYKFNFSQSMDSFTEHLIAFANMSITNKRNSSDRHHHHHHHHNIYTDNMSAL